MQHISVRVIRLSAGERMDRLISPEQAAEAFGVRRMMVYAIIARGDLGSINVGRLRGISASAVDRHMGGRLAELGSGRDSMKRPSHGRAS